MKIERRFSFMNPYTRINVGENSSGEKDPGNGCYIKSLTINPFSLQVFTNQWDKNSKTWQRSKCQNRVGFRVTILNLTYTLEVYYD